MRGRQGIQGPPGYSVPIIVDNANGTITPFTPINCTIAPEGIYLNAASSYYTINISPTLLGSAYTPNPYSINEPGTWDILSIFAAQKEGDTTVPTTYFDMSQQPVTFFIQNISGLPINITFQSNDSNSSLVYFSFGTSPNQTPSSYLLQPLSLLIFETIFTSNNAIRIYNSFLDAIDYNQLYRILDRASKNNYFQQPSNSQGSHVINTATLTSDTTLLLATMARSYGQNIYDISGQVTLTIDGTGLPADAVNLYQINIPVGAQVNLVLINLVTSKNYQGKLVPSVLQGGSTWFLVINDVTVTGYDPDTSGTTTTTLSYSGTSNVVITSQQTADQAIAGGVGKRKVTNNITSS